MPSFGQDLKREREVRGISLQEIAETTKISLRYLQALEEDQFELLPGKFLTRAIIRSYAQFIGLDPDQVLHQYHQLLPAEEKPKEPLPTPEKKPIFRPTKQIISTVAIIFLLSLAVIAWFIFKSPAPQVQELLIFTELPSTQTKGVELLGTNIISLPSSIPLKLNFTFNQETWLQVYTDGILKINGLLFPGDTLSLEAHQEFLLHIGNAGGFHYTLNGLPGRPLGQPGQVRKNLRINRQNYHYYINLNSPDTDHLSNLTG
ncbi:MAG TPA: helix-turn-helix domain-containing protein [Candidatus Aminicenantes bacterium]|nr:helix-turn-helix domain-containing protein [Candidatus Aminicenantes bacterium]